VVVLELFKGHLGVGRRSRQGTLLKDNDRNKKIAIRNIYPSFLLQRPDQVIFGKNNNNGTGFIYFEMFPLDCRAYLYKRLSFLVQEI
jgi:hypothetical protein